MKTPTSLLALGLPVACCLGACQSIPPENQALQVAPTETVRHGTARPEALYALGRYFQGQRRYDKAIDAYQKLLAEQPGHAAAHNALGVIYSAQGKPAAALEEFAKAVASAPESASIRNNLGYAYLLQSRFDDAWATLTIAARLDPANQRVRDNLAVAVARSAPGHDQATPAMARPAEPAAPVDSRPARGVQLVAVTANVFELQMPARQPEKPAVAASQPLATPQPLALPASPPASPVATPLATPLAIAPADAAPPPAAAIAAVKPKVGLEVSNGNGTTGLAKKMSSHLQDTGYGRIRITNEPPYVLPATAIQYRPGFESQARELQLALKQGVPLVATQQLRADIQVRLLLGKDVRSVPEAMAAAPAAERPAQLAAAVQ